jgi:membrane protein DedA with SNARE-associated domain
VHFFRFAWLSAIAWVLLLTGIGYSLTFLPEKVAHIATVGLMLAPFATLGLGIMTLIISWIIKKDKKPTSI